MSFFISLTHRYVPIALLIAGSAFASFSDVNIPLTDDAPDTWQRMVPEVDNPVGNCSMILNSQGFPCFSYTPAYGSVSGVVFAEFDGSSWQETVVDNAQYLYVKALLKAPGGYTHIVYTNASNDSFIHAWHNGSQWQTEVFWADAGNGLDCTLDSQGSLHVLLTDSDNDVYYGSKDGDWSFEKIGSTTSWPIALTMDSNDEPHAVWSSSGSVKHCWHTSSGWLSENITSAYLEALDFTADQQDNLHLVIQRPSSISYYHKTASTWETEVIDSMSGDYCSIAVASDGTVHVAYDDNYNSDLRYAERLPSGWSSEVVTWEGTCGISPSIQLDEQANPWICHSRFTEGEIVWWGQGPVSTASHAAGIFSGQLPVSISPNPLTSTGTINLDIQQEGRYTLTLFDVSGRELYTPLDAFLEPSTYQVMLNASNLPAGTVFVQLRGNGSCCTERMLILRQ